MRFTIRDLLWLVALAAVGLGWWINRLQLLDGIDKARNDASPGRYAFVIYESWHVVIDTQTGQMWQRSPHGSHEWLNYKSPVFQNSSASAVPPTRSAPSQKLPSH